MLQKNCFFLIVTETRDLLQFAISLHYNNYDVLYIFWYSKIYLTIQRVFFLNPFLKDKDRLNDSRTETNSQKEKQENELKMLDSGFVSTDIYMYMPFSKMPHG